NCNGERLIAGLFESPQNDACRLEHFHRLGGRTEKIRGIVPGAHILSLSIKCHSDGKEGDKAIRLGFLTNVFVDSVEGLIQCCSSATLGLEGTLNERT